MTPDFQILADTIDVTAAIRRRLISIGVTDAAGMEIDTVELSLDDRDGAIALPRTGAELAVKLGYRETGLATLGLYVVDEVLLASPPRSMTIRARAADLRQGLKRPRTRPWDNVTLADIVTTIAREHGYEPRVSAKLASESIAHIDQADESDLHFLTRLAGDRGAVAKPADGLLLFVLAGEAKSASGRDLLTVEIAAAQVGRCEVTLAERGKYAAVTARWHDAGDAAEKTVTAGDGEPVFTIGRRYPDRAAATAAAKARLEAFERGVATVRLTCPGDVRLAAECRIRLSGFRPGIDGIWNLTRVTHRLDEGGYVCDIEGETPTTR